MSYTPWTGRIVFPGVTVLESETETVRELNVQVIPLDVRPNQSFECQLYVDGRNINLRLNLRFNEMARYWVMTIANPATMEPIIDSIPLVTGRHPASNILDSYAYLGMGSAYVVPMSGVAVDFPDDTNLGADFVLAWSDTR